MSIVYISLGSNMGDRAANLAAAVDFIASKDGVQLLKQSSYLENAAIEGAGPNDFLNAVIKIETKLEPYELLEFLQSIEAKLGRQRALFLGDTHKLPRTIDLDILIYDDLMIDEPKLKIPHPRMLYRDFVMQPLLEIEPEFSLGYSDISVKAG